MGDETLQKWLQRWRVWNLLTPRDSGPKGSWSVRVDLSNGQLWTRSGSEWRRDGVACSLSQILETGPIDPRYYLSPRACEGILRRAEKRGKKLPEPLRLALEAVAGRAMSTSPPEDT